MSKAKTKIAFTWRNYTSSTGYDFTTFRIFTVRPVELAKRLAGTVDNRAGYGSLDAAQRVARHCQTLIDQGHTHTWEHPTFDAPCVNIEWQHYPTAEGLDYCEPSFSLGRQWDRIEGARKLLHMLGRRIAKVIDRENGRQCFGSPEQVAKHLHAMRDVMEVHLAPGEGHVDFLAGAAPAEYSIH